MYTESVSELINCLVDAHYGDWSWLKNTGCKYLTINIDMRPDGKCMIRDRNGKVITIEQLKRQVGDE